MKHIKTKTYQSGVSIVELMVGMVIGLFIVGGASTMFVNNLNSNRHLLIETRVNQDLRAAADVISRDIRRANYWGNATTGLFGLDATAVASNPHTGASAPLTVDNTNHIVTYSYARDTNDQVNSNEYAGFKLESVSGIGVLKIMTSENVWQDLTDQNSINVTVFNATEATPPISNNLSKYCPCLKTLGCDINPVNGNLRYPKGGADWTNPPTLTIPRVTFSITGHAVSDPAIERTFTQTVRVRNPVLTGSCPS